MKSALTNELEALRSEDGLLRPETIVAAARDSASPLHNHFEWDDAAAAQIYRIAQARALIRQVKIPVRIATVIVRTNAWVPSPTVKNAYERVDEVDPGSAKAHAIVMDELTRCAGILGRARRIAIALGLESEIDDLIQSLEGIRARVEKPAETVPA
jgi:hypothetical protein